MNHNGPTSSEVGPFDAGEEDTLTSRAVMTAERKGARSRGGLDRSVTY